MKIKFLAYYVYFVGALLVGGMTYYLLKKLGSPLNTIATPIFFAFLLPIIGISPIITKIKFFEDRCQKIELENEELKKRVTEIERQSYNFTKK